MRCMRYTYAVYVGGYACACALVCTFLCVCVHAHVLIHAHSITHTHPQTPTHTLSLPQGLCGESRVRLVQHGLFPRERPEQGPHATAPYTLPPKP
jgi:hypothetical protein